MENFPETQTDEDLNSSLKLAMALAIAESRRIQRRTHTDSQSESDAVKWKRKAKQRKEEIIRLKEDLKLAEDGVQHDLFPQSAVCKCYFYDNVGQVSTWNEHDQSRTNDVLRCRFLRQVRLSERKRRRVNGSLKESCISDSAIESELEQLKASADFLVDLCQTPLPLDELATTFKNWSHQAIDFILATLETLSSSGKINETAESIVYNLIVRLLQRMCNGFQNDDVPYPGDDLHIYVQHLIRNLGSDSYVGQRAILSVSQRISVVAESLLFMDPFDAAFPKLHSCMYLMIQLIEFLIADYLLSWSARQDLDLKLLEEWLISVLHAKKALEVLDSRNALYILYMDRVVGDLTRRLGQTSFHEKLPPEVLGGLFG